jgi:hypothetical protein
MHLICQRRWRRERMITARCNIIIHAAKTELEAALFKELSKYFDYCTRKHVQLSKFGAIGTGAIQVEQDVAGFGTFAGTNDAAIFQFVHNAGGATVAEA